MKAERLAEIKSFNPKPTDLVDWEKLQTAVLEYLPELVAEVERQSEQASFWYSKFADMVDAYEDKDMEIARLRKALEFYAYEKNWQPSHTTMLTAMHYDYSGQKAREALQNE